MPSPTNPKRLQIRDRIVTVLTAITAGANYFYTPAKVLCRLVHLKEADAFPTYCVTHDSGGENIDLTDNSYDSTFYISVYGYVRDESDPTAALIKAVRDVERAINEDWKSGASGTLGVLAVRILFPEPPETDNGILALDGSFGYFNLRVRFTVTGDWGAI